MLTLRSVQRNAWPIATQLRKHQFISGNFQSNPSNEFMWMLKALFLGSVFLNVVAHSRWLEVLKVNRITAT